jgi:hypothetical protein
MVAPTNTPQCSNCQLPIPTTQWRQVAGDHAVVQKTGSTDLHRFDLVAFRSPEEPGTLLVKRIVGLPGESVRITAGQIERQNRLTGEFEICSKPPAQILQAARCLHDDRFRSPHQSTRWQSADRTWQTLSAGYQLMTNAGELRYAQYVLSVPNSSLPTHPITDLIIELTWSASSPSSTLDLELETTAGRGSLSIHPDAVELSTAGFTIAQLPRELANPSRWRLAHVDSQWILWHQDRLLGQWPDPQNPSLTSATNENPLRKQPNPSPLIVIRATGKGSKVTDLVLSEDVYYTSYAWESAHRPTGDPLWGESSSTWELKEDEYLALGDNTAHSRDSRHWRTGPAIPARLLVGKVLARFSLAGWPEGLRLQQGSPNAMPTKAGNVTRPKQPIASQNNAISTTK